jgi:hypothetical protein
MLNKYLFLCFAFLSFLSRADGIPTDKKTGKILAKNYFTITLTEDQAKSLEYQRYIELTEEQKRFFHPRWPIETLDVFDPYHADCTCGVFEYGIWTGPKELTLLGDSSEIHTEEFLNAPVDDYFGEYIKDVDMWAVEAAEYYQNYMYIGIDGDIYFDTQKITIELAREIFENKPPNNDERWMVVYVAPKTNNPNADKIEHSISELKRVGERIIKLHWM